MIWGERLLAGLFGLFGIAWIVQSLRLRYWSDFAPGTGFFPLWLGIILTALVALFLLMSLRASPVVAAPAPDAAPPRFSRIAAIIAGLFVCIAVIDDLGYGVSVAAYLLFLLGYVERRAPLVAIGVALGTTLVLYLIFKVWLGVPLPRGPWGF
jgi:putative tricarboxylic transport membrane protein